MLRRHILFYVLYSPCICAHLYLPFPLLPEDLRCQSPFWHPHKRSGVEENWCDSAWGLRAKEALERCAPRPAAHRMIYSVWSARKHFPTYLGVCRRRPAGLFDTTHVTDISDLKESPIIGWLACLGSPDKWFCPCEEGQGEGKVLHRKGEQDGGGQSNLEDPRLAWKKTIEKEVIFCQSSQAVLQRNSQSICQSWKKTLFSPTNAFK